MFYVMAPAQFICAKFKTKPEAEAELNRRKGSDQRYEFLVVYEASSDSDARLKALKFYDALERKTGKRWKN